ncbi:MAG: MFS transporter [Clostridia bacterium]|nr:MFS transporter [Clostridia bacterium]
MKLNVKNTTLVGFAFLSICAFWQLYDTLTPLLLTNTFHLDEVYTGSIMAADNVLAVFLLPIFGALSDRCKSPLGRRRPYIFVGTVLAVLFMMTLPFIAGSYHTAPSNNKLMLFVAALGLLLISMGIYRSPAVALMPDVTPKPLRSKGNAIINLMGAIGGALFLLLTTFIYKTKESEHETYLPLFAIVGGIMLLALLVLFLFVNEPKLVAKQKEYENEHPEEELTEQTEKGAKLPKGVKLSLLFLLLSVSFWYIGYNGVTTWFSVYVDNVWGKGVGGTGLCLLVATAGAMLSYIPVGNISAKIGRRKVIRFGALLLAASFFLAFIYTLTFKVFSPALYVLFVLVGIAWAAINVNSFPMVVEMCAGSDVGKYTGLYYTFSMIAQIVTPIVAGWLLKNVAYESLFIYAAVAVFISFLTMGMVKHGDSKPEAKKGLEAFDVED